MDPSTETAGVWDIGHTRSSCLQGSWVLRRGILATTIRRAWLGLRFLLEVAPSSTLGFRTINRATHEARRHLERLASPKQVTRQMTRSRMKRRR